MVSLCWEEVDSCNSGTGKFTCISGASAPKRWFRRNAPRGVNRAESTIPSIKKRHRNFSKEVDSLGVGQFSNIQQNAALCSAMIN